MNRAAGFRLPSTAIACRDGRRPATLAGAVGVGAVIVAFLAAAVAVVGDASLVTDVHQARALWFGVVFVAAGIVGLGIVTAYEGGRQVATCAVSVGVALGVVGLAGTSTPPIVLGGALFLVFAGLFLAPLTGGRPAFLAGSLLSIAFCLRCIAGFGTLDESIRERLVQVLGGTSLVDGSVLVAFAGAMLYMVRFSDARSWHGWAAVHRGVAVVVALWSCTALLGDTDLRAVRGFAAAAVGLAVAYIGGRGDHRVSLYSGALILVAGLAVAIGGVAGEAPTATRAALALALTAAAVGAVAVLLGVEQHVERTHHQAPTIDDGAERSHTDMA